VDANKLSRLTEIGYRIGPQCGLCRHGRFTTYDWGSCDRHQYEHGKHTGPARALSIFRGGVCDSGYELDPGRLAALGGFEQKVQR
jgi:hypothetical protein